MKRGAVLAFTALALLGGATSADGSRQPRIGFVFDGTGVNDLFQHAVLVGLRRAARELGVQTRTLAPGPHEGYVPSYAYLARRKYDLIIGLGFNQSMDLDTAAARFPDSTFALLDTSWDDLKHRPKNVRGTLFKTEEAGYLAGYLAALVEMQRPGRHVIGSVGGIKFPTVDAFIAGYRAGARKADPSIVLLNGYANDFLVPAKCRAIALQQIAAGAGVVFDVASNCGLGALAAAREKGAWGIGVDVDQSDLGPHILTSVVKRLDVAAFNTIESFKRGTFRTGGNATFNLRNGGVGLGRTSPKVPASFLRRLAAIRAQIVARKITVPSSLSK